MVFACGQSSCVGVLTMPPERRQTDVAVIIVVGGPQYRVGSHRQFVRLARGLASAGICAFRFDYRGMGDSAGDMRNFEHIREDICAAIDVVCENVMTSRVVLWGLCDGASAAIMYATSDPRVVGMTAVNPWTRSEQGLATARVKHYYTARMLDREFWTKLFRGRVSIARSLYEVFTSLKLMLQRKLVHTGAAGGGNSAEPFLKRMHEQWLRFREPTLVLLSGNDLTAKEFIDWIGHDTERVRYMRRDSVTLATLAEADHTFSRSAWMDWTIDRTREWIIRLNSPRS